MTSPVHPDQSVSVLVDTQNMYHAAQNLYSNNLDYSAVLEDAVRDRSLKRALAYVVRTDTDEEESFFEALTRIGFETKVKDMKEYPNGTRKANWDMGIAMDAVTFAPGLDAMVLCTGDGDFTRVVHYVREEGVRVEILGFGSSTSQELIDAADEFIDLQENPDRFVLG